MNISGFTFIKNAISLGYPILESISSIEPLCEEIVINVGYDHPDCLEDDGTYEFLRQHFTGKKYKFIKSFWDPTIRERGLILSQQTNIALSHCQYPLCFYIQADEAIHEKDYQLIEADCRRLIDHKEAQGLVFHYRHFYGNVNVEKYTQNVYRREIRVIKNFSKVQSWLDAQGFRLQDGKKMKALLTQASIYHYGWAREQEKIKKKTLAMNRLYHGNAKDHEEFSYTRIWGLQHFRETHPQVMQDWIKMNHNSFDPLSLPYHFELRDLRLILGDVIEKLSGWRMGEYKGYQLVS